MSGVPLCPQCGHNFDANFDFTDADGRQVYRCESSHGGDGPISYQSVARPAPLGAKSSKPKTVAVDKNKTEDLLDPLLACLRAEDGWTEFGVIEYRLSRLARDVFARHVRERGHVMFGSTETLEGSASGNRVSQALRRLVDAGSVVKRSAPSTGEAWKQTTPISYWALTPLADAAGTLTWEQFCAQIGRPTGWTDEDREGLSSPAQGVP